MQGSVMDLGWGVWLEEKERWRYFRGRNRAKGPQTLPSGSPRSKARKKTQTDHRGNDRTKCRGESQPAEQEGAGRSRPGAAVRASFLGTDVRDRRVRKEVSAEAPPLGKPALLGSPGSLILVTFSFPRSKQR